MVTIYFALVFFLVVLLGLVIVNFLRYRYKGDRSVLIVIIVLVFFSADIIFTLGLLHDVPSVTTDYPQ